MNYLTLLNYSTWAGQLPNNRTDSSVVELLNQQQALQKDITAAIPKHSEL